uniref:FH1/FH2 domain-containing protein 3 n=1 Tax=Zeugodacus cucurbitae TaxID=28588 RepID=A0A0A1X7H1_ZEUCU
MREVLASIPGFSFKPRRRSSKKISTAAQIEQTKDGKIDLETPDSILASTNLRALLNKQTFSMLPPLYQYNLIQLLPSVDREAIEIERKNNVDSTVTMEAIKLGPSSLNNEFFARACLEWRERLAEGEFTPENQMKMKTEAEREKNKLDPWKLKHFEPIWGEKSYNRASSTSSNSSNISYSSGKSSDSYTNLIDERLEFKLESKGGLVATIVKTSTKTPTAAPASTATSLAAQTSATSTTTTTVTSATSAESTENTTSSSVDIKEEGEEFIDESIASTNVNSLKSEQEIQLEELRQQEQTGSSTTDYEKQTDTNCDVDNVGCTDSSSTFDLLRSDSSGIQSETAGEESKISVALAALEHERQLIKCGSSGNIRKRSESDITYDNRTQSKQMKMEHQIEQRQQQKQPDYDITDAATSIEQEVSHAVKDELKDTLSAAVSSATSSSQELSGSNSLTTSSSTTKMPTNDSFLYNSNIYNTKFEQQTNAALLLKETLLATGSGEELVVGNSIADISLKASNNFLQNPETSFAAAITSVANSTCNSIATLLSGTSTYVNVNAVLPAVSPLPSLNSGITLQNFATQDKQLHGCSIISIEDGEDDDDDELIEQKFADAQNYVLESGDVSTDSSAGTSSALLTPGDVANIKEKKFIFCDSVDQGTTTQTCDNLFENKQDIGSCISSVATSSASSSSSSSMTSAPTTSGDVLYATAAQLSHAAPVTLEQKQQQQQQQPTIMSHTGTLKSRNEQKRMRGQKFGSHSSLDQDALPSAGRTKFQNIRQIFEITKKRTFGGGSSSSGGSSGGATAAAGEADKMTASTNSVNSYKAQAHSGTESIENQRLHAQPPATTTATATTHGVIPSAAPPALMSTSMPSLQLRQQTQAASASYQPHQQLVRKPTPTLTMMGANGSGNRSSYSEMSERLSITESVGGGSSSCMSGNFVNMTGNALDAKQKLRLQQQLQQQQTQQAADYYTPYGRSMYGEKLFISRHQNIDELLGGSCRPLSPIFLDGSNSFATVPANRNLFIEEITPDQVRIHDSTAQMPVIQRMERDEWDNYGNGSATQPPAVYERNVIDDAAIQVYKDGDYGAYLDLESSLAEQAEEIEGLNSSRKNSLVVRTQLSVRVHAIIEKLLSSEGSELRRALFSLKQVFQEDKDLVHAFVALGGLNCLVRVGNGADQNYQNYILRALGQVMLYVDGMNGVMKHEPTMQWLYSLIASNYRSVVKTALKLLLVFVEYAETNCYVLVNAIHAVDKTQGTLPWSNLMRLLKDYDNADAELVIYATSLINKTLAGLNDQDSFYDESDLLEQQGMESVIQRYMSKPGTDLDLLDQLQLYEAVLKFEDGEAEGIRLPENSLRKTQRHRQSTDTAERRKSRRHSTGTSPHVSKVIASPKRMTPTHGVLDEDSSGSTNSAEFTVNGVFNGDKARDGVGVTPGLRRRRERAERHKSFLKEQQEAVANGIFAALERREEIESDNEDRKLLQQLKRDHTVKDLTQKLSNMPMSPTHEEKLQNRIVGDMSGLISKAKEGLAKSKSKGEMSRSSSLDQDVKKVEPKKSENELHWEELVRNMVRPLNLCDLDFTDLNSEDEKDMLAPRGLGVGIPPPPPPFGGVIPPPMMPPAHIVCPPPNSLSSIAPPPLFSYSGYGSMTNSANSSMNGSMNGDMSNTNTIRKNKKTVKLFWKEVREDMIPVVIGKTIWDELPASNVDTQKLEHLFESRAKDLMTKKQQELNKSKEIIVLDHKRSNAINIAMTKLPPPRAIKAAILKMDATVVTREGIDKLLNMLPTDEERGKIQEAQMANPELPLGSAEQFLLTLASISELGARLKLWAFRLDFDNSEKEIAEPLMDLKQGIEILRNNRTFKCILSTLLSVGIFLNGAPVKGFQIEYLSKVPEVKDTVHKHSLLHHLCHMVMESSPDTTDLYSEIGPITRASKADFSDLAHNLSQLETECKASWDRLKLIAKHDCPPQLKQKLVDFLADCAERIIILQIVHRRVINRYRKFLLWLGAPQHTVSESKPNEFCRILSEFALEYRTTRERVQQQLEKKANHRERNKTRGKLIIDMAKFKTKEDRADAELKELLGTASADTPDANGTLTWRRRRAEQLRSPITRQSEENFTDGDDEILESLVKTATKAPGTRTTPRERKRTRHADRKSLKRSRTREGFTVERAPSP